MKVKVTWRNNNPFAPIECMGRVSEAELNDGTDFKTIEEFAREATPDRYHLHEIDMDGKVFGYDYHGNKIA